MKPGQYLTRADVEFRNSKAYRDALDKDEKRYREVKYGFEDQLATETPDQSLESQITYGSVNPRRYLNSVYRNVPGGIDEVVRIANEYGANVDLKGLNRSVPTHYQNNMDPSIEGAYNLKQDNIDINAAQSNDAKREAIKHEIQHAIHKDNKIDNVYPPRRAGSVTGPNNYIESFFNSANKYGPTGLLLASTLAFPSLVGYAATSKLASLGNKDKTSEPVSNELSNLDKYYGQSNEADAEFFSKAKHWGAEQGILPKNEAEARQLLDLYMKKTGLDKLPAGEGADLKSRAPAIRRRLFKSKYAPVYLLRSVKNDGNSEDSNV
jgi:hypothetical protein